ncbi:hypothetical protein CXB51_036346 [Gossypium anomalum]|uniref:Uncharacterized protein n=1 Tax=Gossypium anomalum TaxID=47600 RepID=A0A8J5XNP1_9ROSI|nr:hypothetical protein CXB51_036346 [Gossypium anomalum]
MAREKVFVFFEKQNFVEKVVFDLEEGNYKVLEKPFGPMMAHKDHSNIQGLHYHDQPLDFLLVASLITYNLTFGGLNGLTMFMKLFIVGIRLFTVVLLSCLFALLISFFGFAARKAVFATAFIVTTVVSKFLTFMINVLIWDKHATPFGLVCLLFTLPGGVLYQQSVTGPPPHDSTASKQTGNASVNGEHEDNQDKKIPAIDYSISD